MKKLILVLAIALIASPVFAAVSVSLVVHNVANDANKVDINYSYDSPSERPRAFALDVTVSGGAKFKAATGISNYKIGESNSAGTLGLGYGIYPARIVINTGDPNKVDDWGSPLADPTDAGAGDTGLGTGHVILEFGSLYVGEGNAPATSGTLCTLTVDCNGQTGTKTVTAVEEDQYRGGVVLEDGTPATVTITPQDVVACVVAPPGQAGSPTPSDGLTCVSITPTLSWSKGSNATSHDVYFGTVDPPGAGQFIWNQTPDTNTTYSPGTLVNNKTYYWRIDEKGDGGTTTGIKWSFTTTVAPSALASGGVPANHAVNIAGSTTLSWAAGDANSHRVFFGPNSVSEMVFKVEQSGITYDPNATGNLGQGRKFYWRIDEKNICGTITTGTVWDFNTQECFKDPNAVKYAAWQTWNRPDCWCYQRQCRGDADGIKSGLYWVAVSDLTLLQGGYNKGDTALKAVTNGICADFDHLKSGLYRVAVSDLTVLQGYYNKGAASVPVCDSNLVNFWTN